VEFPETADSGGDEARVRRADTAEAYAAFLPAIGAHRDVPRVAGRAFGDQDAVGDERTRVVRTLPMTVTPSSCNSPPASSSALSDA
jgi:hypothetical protein